MTDLPELCPACGEGYSNLLGPYESPESYQDITNTTPCCRIADEHDTWAQHKFYHE